MSAPRGPARLDAHHAQYEALVATCRRYLAEDRLDAAAACAQITGQFAWMNHTGLFASPELERLLARIGERIPAPAGEAVRSSDPRTVLHVITQTYQTGGPTQALACWLEQDTGRRHRVCITRQGSTPPPPKLVSRVAGEADLVRLDTARGGLVARAARLRALAMEAEVVVLHTHPYDVVPVIAFAGVAGLPPVVYVNHGDHVFWLGTSITAVLANMRDSGRELAGARRGIDPERSVVLNRPLMPRERELERADAKRRLGVRPDAILVVTAADAPKYRPVEPPSLLSMVLPVAEAHPEVELLAAGPAPEGEWAEAARRTGGRVRALGRLPSVTLLQEAADLYLDSFPFSSLTSLLEAGSLGTPVVTYRGHPEECAVLGADTRGVDEHMLRPRHPQALAEALGDLVADPGRRRELGERAARAIRDTHTGEGWREAARATYAFAHGTRPPEDVPEVPRRTGKLDVLVDEVMTRTGYSQGPAGAMRDHLGLLPPGERARGAVRVMRMGATPTIRHVAPEWMLPHLGNCWRLARGVRHATG